MLKRQGGDFDFFSQCPKSNPARNSQWHAPPGIIQQFLANIFRHIQINFSRRQLEPDALLQHRSSRPVPHIRPRNEKRFSENIVPAAIPQITPPRSSLLRMWQKIKPIRIRAHEAKHAMVIAKAAHPAFIALARKIAAVLVVPLESIYPANVPHQKTNRRRNDDRNEHSSRMVLSFAPGSQDKSPPRTDSTLPTVQRARSLCHSNTGAQRIKSGCTTLAASSVAEIRTTRKRRGCGF
jgi:hypothetical protein